jgi:glycerol-3-phosphate acyltransferase PlsY
MPFLFLIAAVLGYLLGAIPCGYLVARAKGVNIFAVGSRSPGATNVRRVLGRGPGNLVFFLDALKGAAASAWGLLAYGGGRINYDLGEWNMNPSGHVAGAGLVLLGITGLIAAMIGHSFSCFTGFKGGKGVATGTGGLLVIMPLSALIGGAIWILVFLITRYVSLASIIAAASLPVSTWLEGLSPVITGLAAVIAAFVIVRHRANIQRLLHGTENRFVKNTGNAPKA